MKSKLCTLLILITITLNIFGKCGEMVADKIERNILIKKLKGYDIVYDCYNRRETSTDKIVVYAKMGKSRTELLRQEIDDNYLEDVTIKYLSGEPFIYITCGHTHGHFYGSLYALDIKHLKATSLSFLRGNVKDKTPANLEVRNHNGIRFEDDKILDGDYCRDSEGINYSVDYQYKLIKTGPNKFALLPVKQIITKD